VQGVCRSPPCPLADAVRGGQAIVSEKIRDNQFVIQTDRPNVEVSWQVTGLRDDAYARMNPIVVEEDKAEQDRGSCPRVPGIRSL